MHLDAEALAEMLAPIIADEVQKATGPLRDRIAELEARKPEPGPPGEKGERGEPGERGADGANGKDGADGIGAAGAMIDRDGNLILTMTNGETKNLGLVVGRDGKKGKDGRDGLGFEHMDAEALDERTIALKFVRGEEAQTYELVFPVPIYRDVFKEGETYQRGDLVTWGGSLWHCDAETKDKPGTDSWTLAVKKGRDGKDAKPNG